MFRRLAFLLCALCVSVVENAVAAEPFLKPNDVIALVGGEDMVAASEYGYLELLLQRALPGHHLKVRSLAWEGDTVFEQPRDLNYPTLEAQLDEIGATVVIMQFGQMESLAGTSKLPEFIKAYEKLIEQVGAGGKRRVVLMSPHSFDAGEKSELHLSVRPIATEEIERRNETAKTYAEAIKGMADKIQGRFVSLTEFKSGMQPQLRDQVHLTETAQAFVAGTTGFALGRALGLQAGPQDVSIICHPDLEPLRQHIAAKNRLWFHYYRPQNWAFLAGDRTEQPSSRDHKDPSKRWFPEEMKQWLPLIDAKEKEIWDLAAKSAKP